MLAGSERNLELAFCFSRPGEIALLTEVGEGSAPLKLVTSGPGDVTW